MAIQPPSVVSPSKAKTQCAIGTYTSVIQIGTNTIQAANLARSAIAPATRPIVMTQNSIWKTTKTYVGSVPVSESRA